MKDIKGLTDKTEARLNDVVKHVILDMYLHPNKYFNGEIQFRGHHNTPPTKTSWLIDIENVERVKEPLRSALQSKHNYYSLKPGVNYNYGFESNL